ncbi:MAG: hypothetical protein C4331_08090 [Meiothermus sp.]
MKLDLRARHELLSRISSNPDILRGRPRIKGTRIAVSMILEAAVTLGSLEEIQVQWPELSKEDVQAALLYGARSTNYEWITLHDED